MKSFIGYLSLVCLVFLAGCSSNNLRQQTAARTASYNAAAMAEVTSFKISMQLYSWQALGNQALVVYTRPHQAYLLDVNLCPDLPTASSVVLTSNLGIVMSHVDKVWVGGSKYPCQIQHIRPVDLDKLHAG